MPDFQYIACEMSGQEITGVLTAPSRHDALSSLEQRELFPISLKPAEHSQNQWLTLRRGVSGQTLGIFYRQLSDLLRSGVPLLRSLELLEKQSNNPALRSIVQDVREQIAEGSRLAEAMRQHPAVFGELDVSMIRAGEEGSFLEDVLQRIAGFTEHQQELKRKVVGAMVYPAFLMTAMFLVVSGMLVFFIPKFEPIFSRLSEQGHLPWATTTLMSFSEFAQNYWIFGLPLIVLISYAVLKWLRTDSGRETFDRLLLRAPGMGPIVRSLAIARFCRILGTLLRNGVPILQSMRIAKDATGNKILSQAIGDAAENLSEGKTLAQPLGSCGQFPDSIVEMIAVGEEANNLEQVLINIADSMERNTNRLLDLFVRLLEPVMLTVMAGMVLFMVVALLLPILQSSSII